MCKCPEMYTFMIRDLNPKFLNDFIIDMNQRTYSHKQKTHHRITEFIYTNLTHIHEDSEISILRSKCLFIIIKLQKQ